MAMTSWALASSSEVSTVARIVEGRLRRGARFSGAARFFAPLRLAGDFRGIVLQRDYRADLERRRALFRAFLAILPAARAAEGGLVRRT
jgi:hypothetical protein